MKQVIAVLAMAAMVAGCGTIGTMGQKFGFGEDLLKTTVLVVAQREGVDLNPDDVDVVTELLRNSIDLQTELDSIAQRQANQRLLEEQITKYLIDGQLVLDGKTYNPGSTTPITVPTAAHIVTQIKTWYGGMDLSNAQLDARFQLSVSGDGRIWSAPPSDWPPKTDSGTVLGMVICAAYTNSAGEWVGGKFENARFAPTPRSLKNIAAGYSGWVPPPSGTEMTVWAASTDGKLVSTTATIIYP